jgi:hypothetical protein
MRRRHPPAPDREPLPALLMGEAEGSGPAEIIAPHERQTAALLPDDLCVVLEGTGAGTLGFVAAGLLAVFALGVYAAELVYPDAHSALRLSNYAFITGGCAALAWLAHRDLLRPRREFRLAEDGIVVEVWPLVGGPPRVTRIRWREIADCSVSVDYAETLLRVESVRGYTLTLRDRPPRLVTRELIRRFVEQAARHPRAVAPDRRAEDPPLPDVTGERPPAVRGCLTFTAVIALSSAAETILDPSLAQEITVITAVGAIALGVNFWWTLDDDVVAAADRDSRSPVARLRRWLRRVLGIRPG